MDELGMFRQNFREITDDWPDATLDEQQGYLDELQELAMRIGELHGVEATRLLHDVNRLRDSMMQAIAPAQQQRAIRWWAADGSTVTGTT